MGFGSKRKREVSDGAADPDVERDVERVDRMRGEDATAGAAGDSSDVDQGHDAPDAHTDIDSIEGEAASIHEQLEHARLERDQIEEKLKHALADMANMRRRALEDANRAREQAIGRVTQEILPVIDAFDLALASNGDREALLDGVRMVKDMLEDLLGRHGIEVIVTDGASFDPNVHEALATAERTDVPPGTIVAVHQKGFQVQGRVLRPARVIVSSAPPTPDDTAAVNDE